MPITSDLGTDSRIWAAFPAEALLGYASAEADDAPIIRESGMPFLNSVPAALFDTVPHINTNLRIEFDPDENDAGGGTYRPGQNSYYHSPVGSGAWHRHILRGAVHDGAAYTATDQLHFERVYPTTFADDDTVRPFYGVGPETRQRVWAGLTDEDGALIPGSVMADFVSFTPAYTIDLARLFKSINARPLRHWQALKLTAADRVVNATISKGDWFAMDPDTDAAGYLTNDYGLVASTVDGEAAVVSLGGLGPIITGYNFASHVDLLAPLLFAQTGGSAPYIGAELYLDPPASPTDPQFTIEAGRFGCAADAAEFASLAASANPFTLGRRLLVPAGIPHDIYIDTFVVTLQKKRFEHAGPLTYTLEGETITPTPHRYYESGTEYDDGDPIQLVVHFPTLFFSACET